MLRRVRPSTRRRALAGIVGCALVALAGLLWWTSAGPGATAPSDAGAAATTEREGRTTGALAGGDASVASGEAPGVDASVPAGRPREPIALTAPRVTEGEGVDRGAVAGAVVARASGAPVPGAELVFAHAGTTRSVRADDEGRFELAPDEPGLYVLALVTAEGFLPFAPEWGHSPIRFAVRPGLRVDGVRVVLVDARPTTVAVVSPDGSPVPGARVRVFGVDRGERALSPLRARYETGQGGTVDVVAPRGAVVEATHPAHGTGRGALDDAAQMSRRLRIVLREATPARLAGGRTLAGRVVDPEGAPIEGARIVGQRQVPPGEADRALHPQLEATTGADGRFVLRGADPGAYRLIATAEGYARRVREPVVAGAEDVVVRLAPGGRVRVRALDPRGEPVAALTVVVERSRGALASETLAVVSAYDAAGELEVGGLPVGRVRVVVSAPGFAPSPAHEARAVVEEPSLTEVALARGGTVVGRVVSADGSPLGGARVSLEGRLGSGASAVPLDLGASSEADGRFALEGAPPGVRSVVAWAAGHHGRVRSGLGVRAGEVTDAGTIELSPVEDGETPRIELAGIGAVLSAEGDAMVVQRVVEGGGAAEVGLAPGDAIVAIDGRPTAELGFVGCIERIRGPVGTTVRLRVRRAGGEAVERIDVPRRRVRA